MSTSASSSSEILVASGASAAAAVVAPRGGIADVDVERMRGALAGGARLERRSTGSEPSAWIFGRLDDLEPTARELDLPPEASPESVVLAGWKRWGEALFQRLRGAFLVVVWDPGRPAAVIAVDQLGSCSPYVFRDGATLYVATDAAVLRGIVPRPLVPDETSLVHWIARDVPALGRTLFRDVERPVGGTYLTVDAGGHRAATYWRPRYREPLDVDADEASSVMWEALRTSIGRRLRGEGRSGIIMSGGVDSTSVAAAATTLSLESPAAYSAVFPGRGVDESERIDAVVDALDIASVQAEPERAGAFALSLDYLHRWSVPPIGAGYLLEYPLLAEAAADGVTTVLDGQGGDELFAVSGFLLADRVAHGRLISSVGLTRRLPGARGRLPRRLFEAWRYYVQGGLVPYGLHSTLKRRRALHSADTGWLRRTAFELLAETDHSLDWKRALEGPRWWSHKAHLLTRSRELVRLADYLRERAALAGLRAAPPLFDVDLVEAALRIPPEIEFDPDLDRPLIRRATRGLLPDAVRLSVRKSNLAPFYVEVAAGRDLPAMRAVLTASDLRIEPFVDRQAVRDLVEQPPPAGPEAIDWQADVWRLATTECWLRHLESPGAAAALLEGVSLERPAWTIHRRRRAGQSSVAAAAP